MRSVPLMLAEERYPGAPWRLSGQALCAVRLIPSTAARAFVPADVGIVKLLPGHTLGCLLLARYSDSPVGPYHEFILAPALTYAAGRVGFWVARIHVDNVVSIAAGR